MLFFVCTYLPLIYINYINCIVEGENMKEKRRKVDALDVIKNLEKMGVKFSNEKNPIGKIKNFSTMIGEYKPIYFKKRNKKE